MLIPFLIHVYFQEAILNVPSICYVFRGLRNVGYVFHYMLICHVGKYGTPDDVGVTSFHQALTFRRYFLEVVFEL